MSFKRRFTGSNDEPEMPPMPEEMAKAFEEAFKPEPDVTWYCYHCERLHGEMFHDETRIITKGNAHICKECGRFASKETIE